MKKIMLGTICVVFGLTIACGNKDVKATGSNATMQSILDKISKAQGCAPSGINVTPWTQAEADAILAKCSSADLTSLNTAVGCMSTPTCSGQSNAAIFAAYAQCAAGATLTPQCSAVIPNYNSGSSPGVLAAISY